MEVRTFGVFVKVVSESEFEILFSLEIYLVLIFFFLCYAKLCFFLLNGLQICTGRSSRSSKKCRFSSDLIFFFFLSCCDMIFCVVFGIQVCMLCLYTWL